jgi:hypothetical protein
MDKTVPIFKMHLQANPLNMTNLFRSLLCSVVKMRMKMIIMKKTRKKSTEESTNKTENFQWFA